MKKNLYILNVISILLLINATYVNADTSRSGATSKLNIGTIDYGFEGIDVPKEFELIPDKSNIKFVNGQKIGLVTYENTSKVKVHFVRDKLRHFFYDKMLDSGWQILAETKGPGTSYSCYQKRDILCLIRFVDVEYFFSTENNIEIFVLPKQIHKKFENEMVVINSSNSKITKKTTAVYYDFNDVLFPLELRVIKDETAVTTTPGIKSGIITFKGRSDEKYLYDFFSKNMQKDNWTKIGFLKLENRMLLVFINATRCAWIDMDISSSHIKTRASVAQKMLESVEMTSNKSFNSMTPDPVKKSNNKKELITKKESEVKKKNDSPVVNLIFPSESGSILTTRNKKITIKGEAFDLQGIYEVKVNGTEASLGQRGLFTADVKLAIGANIITIHAVDLNDNITTKKISVERAPDYVENNKNEKVTHDEKTFVSEITNYALLIACEDYQDEKVDDLIKPLDDAQALKHVLCSQYDFSVKNVRLLKNPTRTGILDELDRLSRRIDPNSQLLIFYAGHGLWDKQLNQGYWLPTDARTTQRGAWIPNTTIRDYIGGIPSKHTLLISDACFSGGIFRTREFVANADVSYSKLFGLKSKKAITSGTMEVVPDESVFMKYLVTRLKNNQKKRFTSEELFFSLKRAVINNSPVYQVPQFGVIREAGDEGGDFIFFRK